MSKNIFVQSSVVHYWIAEVIEHDASVNRKVVKFVYAKIQ